MASHHNRPISTKVACVQCHVALGGDEGTCPDCRRLIEERIAQARSRKQPDRANEVRPEYVRPVQRILHATASIRDI